MYCQVCQANHGACTRFVGPLEEEQEHAPIELHWPESQPTLVERLQQIWADQHESSMQITLLEMKIDSATTETVKVKAETTKTMTKMMKEMEEMKDDMKEIKEMKDDMKTMKETMKVMQGMMSQVLINSK